MDTEGGIGHVHSVHVEGLEPGHLYYYRVNTGGFVSETYHFKTPPMEDDASFRIVAMSDMQRDDSHPDKYQEIVHEGVIPYLSEQYNPDMPEALAMVLIPGDLVDNGWVYSEWIDDFFAPSQALMAEVPFYPVFGNHEASTPLFNRYFHLPDNGTIGYEEHWWSTDYNNVRIIGMDSNQGYRIQAQLDWLDEVLFQSCTDSQIDFLFVQLHHPYLSELWLPGESDFTGDVISRLETFSSECGKPSIHFFGHTHGYSRGQSLEHRHLWVNVASAGGALDRWGATEQANYNEFTVSQDHYGFVVLDVSPSDNPTFTLKRISRGTPEQPLDNELSDQIEIRFQNTPPERPVGISPMDNISETGELSLTASAFQDSDGDVQGASHWEVSLGCNDFTSPVLSQWQQWQDQWMGTTNISETLTSLSISGLEASTEYCWRVRYRDRGLEWSQWSEPVGFQTGEES